MKLLVVGNTGGTNVGSSFLTAARALSIDTELVDAKEAMEAPIWVRRVNWWLRGRRPTRLEWFSRRLTEKVGSRRPEWLLTTGVAPCHREALDVIGAVGVKRVNYLTDDPFNPSQRAPWFLDALPAYDHVFSPRRANIDDLLRLGCKAVSYLRFGYDPALHYLDHPSSDEQQVAADVMFAGGADRDRLPYITTLIRTGLRVALYGDYWDRFPETRPCARGHADPSTLRRATGAAKVALCLVRRANRDGHTMRSFEIPAIGACMLAEDTDEHREIFGREGEAVVYFATTAAMVEKLSWLLTCGEERARLAAAAHRLITGGGHAYKDRLLAMLGAVGAGG